MTEPVTEQPTLSGDELDQAILAALRVLIKARLSRDAGRIAVAQAEYDRYVAMKYSGA